MSRASVAPALMLLALAQAHAEVGTVDAVPAATLLVPYFEVDLDHDEGVTTLFSVNNAFAGPAIVHVTFWTDLSVPTLDFNLYLTGYEDPTINLRNIFRSGTPGIVQPASGEGASKDGGGVFPEPVGPFSLPTNPITGVGPGSSSCADQLPLPPLPAVLLAHLRAAHTGKPSVIFGGRCSGIDHGDNIARGYITLDNVNVCSLDFPGDAGYFIAGGQGTANNENQLWGDVFYVDSVNNFATGSPLIHLEASDALGADNYTFYRRYSGGADQREGLGTSFALCSTMGS